MYRKYHIYMYFLRKIIFHFSSKEKISYLWEKRNTIFPDITKQIILQCNFCGKTTFSEHLKKPSYFHVFFLRKITFSFPSKEKISYFWKKRNTIFTDIIKKIIFQCNFLGKLSIRNIWKKKIQFFVQCHEVTKLSNFEIIRRF